jgi:hypothetical protein
MLGFHCVDPLEALLGGSEIIPKVFFKNIALLPQQFVLPAQGGVLGLQIALRTCAQLAGGFPGIQLPLPDA